MARPGCHDSAPRGRFRSAFPLFRLAACQTVNQRAVQFDRIHDTGDPPLGSCTTTADCRQTLPQTPCRKRDCRHIWLSHVVSRACRQASAPMGGRRHLLRSTHAKSGVYRQPCASHNSCPRTDDQMRLSDSYFEPDSSLPGSSVS